MDEDVLVVVMSMKEDDLLVNVVDHALPGVTVGAVSGSDPVESWIGAKHKTL